MPPCAIVAQGRSASGRHLASRHPGHERHDDVTVVSLVDEYDISNVEEVLAELGRAVQSGDGVVVSLMQTTFLDSCVVNAVRHQPAAAPAWSRARPAREYRVDRATRARHLGTRRHDRPCNVDRRRGRDGSAGGSTDRADVDVTLGLSTHAPSQVRRSLAERYVGSMETSLLDQLTLLTSELVTNAVQHSERPDGDEIHVCADVSEGVLRVEVADDGDDVDPLEPRSLAPLGARLSPLPERPVVESPRSPSGSRSTS
jgi:hypothetical protein